MPCLFCAISAGDIPSASIYEDELTFAFLDINPLTAGHTLVVPKRHGAKLEDCSPEDAAALLSTAQYLLPVLCKEAGMADATLAINNGPAAGQEVGHVHLHIVPRKTGDKFGPIHTMFGGPKKADTEELHDLAIRVQRRLESMTAKAGA